MKKSYKEVYQNWIPNRQDFKEDLMEDALRWLARDFDCYLQDIDEEMLEISNNWVDDFEEGGPVEREMLLKKLKEIIEESKS